MQIRVGLELAEILPDLCMTCSLIEKKQETRSMVKQHGVMYGSIMRVSTDLPQHKEYTPLLWHSFSLFLSLSLSVCHSTLRSQSRKGHGVQGKSRRVYTIAASDPKAQIWIACPHKLPTSSKAFGFDGSSSLKCPAMLGLVLGRTDFPRICVFEPPDFSRI